MEAGRIPNYKVVYNCNPTIVTDNHKSEAIFLLDVDERNFNNIDEAIMFLGECTSPITTVEQLVPELRKLKRFDWILPESHIRPKHVLVADMEDIFINQDNRWW